jgi:hypothetical protein
MKGSRLQTRSLLSQSNAIPVNVCAQNLLAFMAQQKYMHEFSADCDGAMLRAVPFQWSTSYISTTVHRKLLSARVINDLELCQVQCGSSTGNGGAVMKE